MIAEEEFAQIIQKPSLELVQPSFGSSLFFQRFNDETPNEDPIWHYHPEVELVYIDSGNGKRHIGNHISYYTKGDLLLIGSNLPHYGFTQRLTAKNTEMIIQFKPDFLGEGIYEVVELQKIGELLKRAKHGLSFYGKTKKSVGALLDDMVVMNRFERLLQTIRILHKLALSEEFHLLNGKRATIKYALIVDSITFLTSTSNSKL